MSRKSRRIAAGLAALLCVAAGNDRTVSAEPDAITFYDMIVGIIEGPDPIPMLLWQPDQELDPQADSDPRKDGRPDIFFHPATGRPLAVWAHGNGSDHDIVFTEWNGQGWNNPVLIAGGSRDDLDPRVFVESGGTVQVVWWSATSPQIVYRANRRPGSSSWRTEAVNSGGPSGRRPSVAAWGGNVYVAYERNRASGGQEIVLARVGSGGQYTRSVIAVTTNPAPLDAWLHVEQGRTWIDWKHAADRIAYSRLVTTTWSAPATVVWNDPSWFGELAAREEALAQVFGP